MTWLSNIAETSGHPTGGITLASLDAFISMGEAIAKSMPVYGRGVKLAKNRKSAYHLAIGAMQQRFGPAALEQFRCLSGEGALGFDIGASIHAGLVVATPPKNLEDPSALAGFFLVHGLLECPTRIAILRIAVREPEYRIGIAVAITSINENRKGRFQKVFEDVLGI